MWRFEGSQTLWSYMRRTSLFRDECLVTLAADLAMPEPLAVATVMRQLCENLSVSYPLPQGQSASNAVHPSGASESLCIRPSCHHLPLVCQLQSGWTHSFQCHGLVSCEVTCTPRSSCELTAHVLHRQDNISALEYHVAAVSRHRCSGHRWHLPEHEFAQFQV